MQSDSLAERYQEEEEEEVEEKEKKTILYHRDGWTNREARG